jgi:hypothetical protein
LVLGDSIDVKIAAHNIYGMGFYSPVGSGANIVLVPEIPDSFSNVPAVTSASQISLTWNQPIVSGGEEIIDYRIHYD